MNELISLPLLAPLWARLPHLPPLLRQWGDAPLGRIAAGFTDNPPGQAGQQTVSSALLAAARSMTAPVLGDAAAGALAHRLSANSSILAANYHGVECFPEMVQAIHFFALGDLVSEPLEADFGPVVPVLSCSSVSLQSQTYPRGLMLSRRDAEGIAHVHLPFFSSALQDVMASRSPALTMKQLRTMRALWLHKGRPPLLRWEREAVDAIMDGHVLRPDVLDQPTFGAQVTRVNASLCTERYSQARHVQVIYLEMEALVAELLGRDMEDEGSVMHRILFDPQVRALVLDTLAGVRGCWRTEAINGLALGRTGKAGTVFFWMADEKGRRCPLRLCVTPSGKAGLGFGDTCIPLRPAALRDALAAGTIVPSLFTSYMSLTLDHGLRCFGGIFLAEYLPTMIRGVASAMKAVGSPLRVHLPDRCLAALPLTVQIEDMELRPAGSVELAAAGGLTRAHLNRIGQLTLADVLPLSLATWYRDYVPVGERTPDWEYALAHLASRWNGVTVKPLSS
ncbi:hypothetical protein SAMN04488082_10276 [Desulfomicrobium apsheronum]|uniref:Uncharacterized protein n=1 Tax=Desulfomicrobium apsheronum TaxID=52560 RepID=A0A1I3PQ05_9BACT|nr:hypothetical protein [Desulfomicrobium apsheronum]SFJ23638.1 hypothetical protein SAMN04488082_10276 [Desulfomicrobium apsheronum]